MSHQGLRCKRIEELGPQVTGHWPDIPALGLWTHADAAAWEAERVRGPADPAEHRARLHKERRARHEAVRHAIWALTDFKGWFAQWVLWNGQHESLPVESPHVSVNNFFQWLDVSIEADGAEVESVGRSACRLWHPDRDRH